MYIAIINGPNINLIGKREPEIYGTESLESTFAEIRKICSAKGFSMHTFQSNHEGDLIDKIQNFGYDNDCIGIIINPGALAHYSYALADAIRSVPQCIIEVHISNIYAREEFRQKSVTAAAADSVLCGFGLNGYFLAALSLIEYVHNDKNRYL